MNRHLYLLDFMRGAAAFSVLLFHLGHWLNRSWLATNSGFAVDLFFCLSGYVLCLNYWPRRNLLNLGNFVILRIIRLMPLIMLGGVVSIVYNLLKIWFTHLSIAPVDIVAASVGVLVDIPVFNAPKELGGPQVFPLNGPQYTLFFELFANCVWWSLRKRGAVWWVGAAAILSGPLVFAFGIRGDSTETFFSGFPRVCLSFSLGVLSCRLREKISFTHKGNIYLFVASLSVTILLFYCPQVVPDRIVFFWIIFVVPFLVVTGGRINVGRKVSYISKWMGDISYPIYALHYPIFCCVNGFYRSIFGSQNFYIEAPIVFSVVLLLSNAAFVLFDQPVRRVLSEFAFRFDASPQMR